MRKTNIWNPASKILDFGKIETRMRFSKIHHSFDFDDDYRCLRFPIDTDDTNFGNIVLVEYYSEEKGFYFLFWEKDRYSLRIPSNFIYKVNAVTGETVSEGTALKFFVKYLGHFYLEKIGIEKYTATVRKKVDLINYEIKQTIRSNACAFITGIV